MKFGFFLMPCRRPEENPALGYQHDLEFVQYVESLGFDEVWVGEHHSGGWEPIPAPDLFIAAAAERTKRIKLGTGVVSLAFHDPFEVAERMAFLDQLTMGRILFGVGPGVQPTDVKMFDIPYEKLRPRMDEALDIILKLYHADGPISYEGQFWSYKDREIQVKPFQRPHMPIAVASTGRPHSIEVTGQHGLFMLSAAFQSPASPDQLRKQWESLEQHARLHRKTVRREDWRIAQYLYIAETKKKAYDDVAEGAMRELRDYFFHLGVKPGYEAFVGQPAEEITFDQALAKRGWVIGDPDDCIRWMEDAQQRSGGFGGFLIVATEWTSRENWRKCLELFAKYVMPEINRTNRGLKRSWQQMLKDSAANALPAPYGPGPKVGA